MAARRTTASYGVSNRTKIQFLNTQNANTSNHTKIMSTQVCRYQSRSISNKQTHLPLHHRLPASRCRGRTELIVCRLHDTPDAAHEPAPGLAAPHIGALDKINTRSEQARRGLDSAPRVLVNLISRLAGPPPGLPLAQAAAPLWSRRA